jgi:hypothetical protein
MAEANPATESIQESSIYETSPTTTFGIANGPTLRRLASANSSGQLYPHLQHSLSEGGESTSENVAVKSRNDVGPLDRRIVGLHVRHNCARDPSCSGYHKATRTWEKPSLILDDPEEDLDLEVALGLSDPTYDSVIAFHEPDRPQALAFRNRFDSLSKRTNMDRPTQACELITGNETALLHDVCFLPQRVALEVESSETVPNEDKCLEGSERFWKDLGQWNWRGWERETGHTKRPYTQESNSDTSRQITIPPTSSEPGRGPQSDAHDILTNQGRDNIEDENNWPQGLSFNLPGHLQSATLSSATTFTRSRNSSKESWVAEDNAAVLT